MFRIFLIGLAYAFQRNIYTDTYGGELNDAGLAANTRAKFSDFTGSLTYYVAEKVGTGDDHLPIYVWRPHVVDSNDLVREAMLFTEHVNAGRAYTTHTIPSTTTTTAAPTTTTTTAAPTTTTTTAPPTTTTTTL